MPRPEIKIFLVDDHEVVLNGLKAILNPAVVASVVQPTSGGNTPNIIELSSEFRVVGSALNAEAMLEQLPKLPLVDLLVIDCELPGMNGIEAAQAAKSLSPNLKTIVFSMHCSTALVAFARKHQVDAFVTKGEGVQRLVEAIRKVMSGKEAYPPAEIQSQKPSMTMPANQPQPLMQDVLLSRREQEVLCRITKEMTSQEIADDLNIAYNTVEVHRRNLMMKLDIHKIAGLVKYALENNICGN